MTDRTIASSLIQPPRPSVGEPTWLRVCDDDAALRVPLRRVKSGLKVCVCVKHWKSLRKRPGPLTHSTLLYSSLVWTPSRAALAASMQALFWGGTHTYTHTHTHTQRKRGAFTEDVVQMLQYSTRPHWMVLTLCQSYNLSFTIIRSIVYPFRRVQRFGEYEKEQ